MSHTACFSLQGLSDGLKQKSIPKGLPESGLGGALSLSCNSHLSATSSCGLFFVHAEKKTCRVLLYLLTRALVLSDPYAYDSINFGYSLNY